MEERELVPVRVKPIEKEKEQEAPKQIEELPEDWKPKEIPNRWRAK